jgi:hypothetical protein
VIIAFAASNQASGYRKVTAALARQGEGVRLSV